MARALTSSFVLPSFVLPSFVRSSFMRSSSVRSSRLRVGIIAFAAVAFPVAARAQGTAAPTCTGTPSHTLDACQKVTDLFRFLSPQVGVALAGGNSMIGESGSLGGPGKYSFNVHATVVDGFVPANDVNLVTDGTTPSSNFGAKRAPIPMPSADIAAGIYKGIPMGLTNVGGVDLLIGINYLPDVNKGSVSINTAGSGFSLAYGLRVGITQESAAMPGISVSYRNRKMPTTSILYTPNNDTLTVNGASIVAKSFRVVAGKHYKFVGIAGGLGRDDIDAKSLFEAVINDGPPVGRIAVGVPASQQKVTRNNAFLNLSLGLPKAQLVGEVGWSSAGKPVTTVNTFDGHQANEKYRYYSLGFSFRP